MIQLRDDSADHVCALQMHMGWSFVLLLQPKGGSRPKNLPCAWFPATSTGACMWMNTGISYMPSKFKNEDYPQLLHEGRRKRVIVKCTTLTSKIQNFQTNSIKVGRCSEQINFARTDQINNRDGYQFSKCFFSLVLLIEWLIISNYSTRTMKVLKYSKRD